MNLRQRLRLLNAAGRRSSSDEAVQIPHDGPASQRKSIDIPGACRMSTEDGDVFYIEHVYPLETMWGKACIGGALDVPANGCEQLLGASPRAESLRSLHDAVFVDTETTGLQRGAGTYAFLVGIGRFVADGLRVRQFFMSDYDEELPLLRAVLHEIEAATALVTFNGKSFDWPLLQTRAVLNRLRMPQLPHVDLLHPARRLWSEVVTSCRLVQLETDILGMAREDDVPSELIPGIYFDYVRTRDAEPLIPIFDHNRFDIVTTAALAGCLGAAVADPLHATPTGRLLSGPELYGVGRLLAARNQTEASINCLDAAIQRGLPAALRAGCKELLATLLKRKKQYPRAVEIWQSMVNQGLAPIYACVELAKYHEHVTKELDTARSWTLRALDTLERRRLLTGLRKEPVDGAPSRSAHELIHRLSRIESKIRRAKEKGDTVFPA